MKGPLDGIRVLDASQMLAGPICGMRLGDLGAEVLKIEPPAGEWTRTHGFADAEIGGDTTAYLALNRNKKSVAVNLKSPDGLDVFYELVRRSDVFLQNFRVGTADRLGIGYEKLHEINPRLVYCSISGYGESGPLSQRPGQDLVVQGYSGSMWSVGSREDPPTPGALWAIDSMTGYQAAIGILAVLRERDRTGRGQKVAINMLAVVMDCQVQELTTHLNLGLLPERTEGRFAHAWVTAPYGAYRTRDGWIVLGQAPLDALGEAVGSDRLRQMTEWSDGIHHRDEVFRILSEILPARTTAEWLDIFDRHRLWAGPVYDYSELVADPHVQATGMIASVDHPQHGRLRFPNVPIRFSESTAEVRTPPPLLGEHTEQVLADLLGYDSARIDRLRSGGAIETAGERSLGSEDSAAITEGDR